MKYNYRIKFEDESIVTNVFPLTEITVYQAIGKLITEHYFNSEIKVTNVEIFTSNK